MLIRAMRIDVDRTVLTVRQEDGLWRVDHGGEPFGHSADKEEARAAAHRHARTMFDQGRACRVQVYGELGYGAI